SAPPDAGGALLSRSADTAARSEPAPPQAAPVPAEPPPPAAREQAVAQDRRYQVAPPPAVAVAPPELYKGAREAPATPGASAPAEARDTRAGERKLQQEEAQVKTLAARAPASVELSLAVDDRAAAERDVAALVERLGGAMVPGPAPGTFEIMVPRDAVAPLA